ncbi:hypothetical protein [Tenacibaculum sp. C7A-26P2]|uniref:hypothetical protein n=1 Tax=Tenacibaculum sp. C7A-26P2 TaxID=3447504 RepID=UPI003F86DABF
MNKLYFNFCVVLFMIHFFSFGQEKSLGARIILSTNNITETNFYVYKPSFKSKPIYNSINEVKNSYPEELMSSILSANSQEWVNYNTLGGEKNADKKSESHFNKVNNYNKDKTYFELQAKLEFNSNGSKIAIVKFYFHQQDKEKPVAGALIMQRSEEVWKVTSKPYLTQIAMALMVFKPDVMERLLSNNPKNEFEKELLKSVYKDGFSFELLLKQNLTNEQKEYFTNPLNW